MLFQQEHTSKKTTVLQYYGSNNMVLPKNLEMSAIFMVSQGYLGITMIYVQKAQFGTMVLYVMAYSVGVYKLGSGDPKGDSKAVGGKI